MPWQQTYRPKRVDTYPGGPTVLGGSEKRVALQLKEAGVPFTYETEKVKYHVAKDHTYTPDFKVKRTFMEVKGLFTSADRVKHLTVKEQHPSLDIRFIFDNSSKRLSKVSKTTYASWCKAHGFQYADKLIPKEWLQ